MNTHHFRPSHSLQFIRKLPPAFTSRIHPKPGSIRSDMRNGIVKTAMYKFADPAIIDEVLQQRRSDATAEALTEDFFKTDQPKVDVKRDAHYLRALKVTTDLFRPKQLYKPVAFPDLRYYPWTLNTSAEAPFTTKPVWTAYLAKKFSLHQADSLAMTFHNMYDEIFWQNRLLVHKIKDGDSAFF